MKRCPYCAEEIQDAAIKCKHCGEFLDGAAGGPPPLPGNKQSEEKWYFKPSGVLFAFLGVGPLALPLIWWNPHWTIAKKLLWTAAALIVTGLLILATIEALHMLKDAYAELMRISR